MTGKTNVVKCPQCGLVQKAQGIKTFRCCGSSWNINQNLVGSPTREEKDMEEEEEKGEEEGYTLPAREKPPKVRRKKEPEEDLVCDVCGGDVYSTPQAGVYFCAPCQRYLTE
jgi:tRNA(Ile2) C34 agmatinyltransferase TiaS